MAYMARSFGYAPGMGAAAAGGFPGLSPQTLAFIEGLKQQQRQAAQEQARYERQTFLDQEQMRQGAEEKSWNRKMGERAFGLKEAEAKEGSRLKKAGMIAPLMANYQQRVSQILGSTMTEQQKQVELGRARNEVASMVRLLGGEDFAIDSALGPTPTPEATRAQIAGTPRQMSPEQIASALGEVGQVQDKSQYYRLLDKQGAGLGEFDRLPQEVRGALQAKFQALPNQEPSFGDTARIGGQVLSQLPDVWRMLKGEDYDLQMGTGQPLIPKPVHPVQRLLNMLTGG